MAFELQGTCVEPVTTTLTVGEGVGSRISLLGIDYSGDGIAGFSAPSSLAA
jgi:hypothetical protein